MAATPLGRTRTDDPTAVQALPVGGECWVIPQLRGRTLTVAQAEAVLLFADTLDAIPPGDCSLIDAWSSLAKWAAAVGLTVREVAAMVNPTAQIPAAITAPVPPREPAPPRRKGGWSWRPSR
ncbi:hypothetical protein [Nocardia sp. IFM 10818]